MNTVTHALLPVIAVSVAERPAWLGRGSLVLIGIAGALPDLLNPHFTLESRMRSWSHGLPCFALFSILVLAGCLVARGRVPMRLGMLVCAAYLLHLLCDSVSGGINWLHPLASLAWGHFWVHPLWWIPLDIACLLACYYLFRYRTMRQALRKS